MEYKKTPPPRTTEAGNGLLGGPKAKPAGLPDEDNYEIQVWESEDGAYIGTCFRSSMNGITHQAWLEAIKTHPGKYLVNCNGKFVVRTVVAPNEVPDAAGIVEPNNILLGDIPQWYGLVARCECGNINYIDRYDRRLKNRQADLLIAIAKRLSCTECTKAKRPKGEIKISLYKLPR